MRARFVFILSALALLLAACGGGTDTGQTGDDGTGATDTATETEAESSPTEAMTSETEMGSGEAAVAVASSDLGDLLVDGEGMTLYLFVPDDQGTPTCTDGCAENWPVFEGPATAGEGADEGMLGTAEHPSGVTQVTYNGWPLYYFAPDEQPGDTNGQGVGDNWYVVSPSGEAIEGSEGDASGY